MSTTSTVEEETVGEEGGEESETSDKKKKKTQPAKKKGGRKKSLKGGTDRGSSKTRRGSGLSRSKNDEGMPWEVSGQGIFYFRNRDRYIGEYTAIFPHTVFRQGLGIYKCNDGLIFNGQWERDVIVNGKVQWPCGQCYTGPFQEGKYYGNGQYFFPGRGTLYANFNKNSPEGIMLFIDLAGLHYVGSVRENREVAILQPIIPHVKPPTKEEVVFGYKKVEQPVPKNDKKKEAK